MSQLAVIPQGTRNVMTQEDIEVLRKSKFKDFSDEEISYCIKVCNLVSLNPLLNQMHFVKRKGVITAQTGIDGYRLTAQRAGGYAGSDEPTYEIDRGHPVKASITVYKIVSGVRCAFSASARWTEYCPAPPNDTMWKKMPFNQLSKCAEALALRKAFPAELAVLRADEEMEQADNPAEDKAKGVQEIIEAEHRKIEDVVTQEQTAQTAPTENPMCCGRRTIKDKFPDRTTGALMYYCMGCRKKVAQ